MDDFSYLPKYAQVKKLIENDIGTGLISVGDKIPAENVLVEKYNVSRHTVRRALDILEREGVLEKKQGIGTFYKGKSFKSTKNIGFISISLYDYIFADILSGVDDILHQNGYQIILGNSRDNIEREREILEQFLEKGIDGLIIEPAKSALPVSNISLLKKFSEKGVPVVILDSSYSGQEFNNVLVDDQQGGFTATDYLIKMGHSKIAMVYKKTHKPALARLNGYKEALSEAGLPLITQLIKPYYNSEFEKHNEFKEEINRICCDLLELEQPPTGIFCFNDQIAVLLNELFSERGIRIPGDISLVGFDDSSLVSLNKISISSVSHPKKAAGEKAANIIVSEIKKGKANSEIEEVFATNLVERDSVKCLNKAFLESKFS